MAIIKRGLTMEKRGHNGMSRLWGFVCCLVALGCVSSMDIKSAAPLAPSPEPSSELGQEVVCPVTGERFVVGPETTKATYEGITYYFCCSGCWSEFDASRGQGSPATISIPEMGDPWAE